MLVFVHALFYRHGITPCFIDEEPVPLQGCHMKCRQDVDQVSEMCMCVLALSGYWHKEMIDSYF